MQIKIRFNQNFRLLRYKIMIKVQIVFNACPKYNFVTRKLQTASEESQEKVRGFNKLNFCNSKLNRIIIKTLSLL